LILLPRVTLRISGGLYVAVGDLSLGNTFFVGGIVYRPGSVLAYWAELVRVWCELERWLWVNLWVTEMF
jgi:hypothetical protein